MQLLRKELDLNVADRIRLRYRAEGEVSAAVEEWRDYIMKETLAVDLSADEGLADDGGKTVKAGVEKVVVALDRA